MSLSATPILEMLPCTGTFSHGLFSLCSSTGAMQKAVVLILVRTAKSSMHRLWRFLCKWTCQCLHLDSTSFTLHTSMSWWMEESPWEKRVLLTWLEKTLDLASCQLLLGSLVSSLHGEIPCWGRLWTYINRQEIQMFSFLQTWVLSWTNSKTLQDTYDNVG